jgi:hypothetical protein
VNAGWATNTFSDGEKRSASAAQLAMSDAGATMRLGRRSPPPSLTVSRQRENLDRLAEPHVVGETGAEAEPRQKAKPAQPDG